MATPLIPKKLHMIWVGDETKCPHAWIETWRDQNPQWQFKLWGNRELDGRSWRAQRQIDIYRREQQWAGVVDLMRYEILHEEGDFYADADSECIRPLDDWLLSLSMFAVYESEKHKPGLVANGFIGAVSGHPALGDIIAQTSRMNSPTRRWSWRHMRKMNILPWKATGPRFFTRMIAPHVPQRVAILPSILFLPTHFLDVRQGVEYPAIGYARHHWGSTLEQKK